MEKIRLGRTGLMVTRTAFGALPIQRLSREEAARLLRRAYEGGINFFDTARSYSDSEEKIGYALGDVRDRIIIATKSHSKTPQELREHIETSLRNLKTDYIDIYQFHGANERPSDEMYEQMLRFKEEGKIRFIGITSHSFEFALSIVPSGMYDTMQFPFSCISSEEDLKLVELCKNEDVGFIAMKAMAGGMITNVPANFALIRSLGNVVPIWGMQRETELEQFLSLEENPPVLTEELMQQVEKQKQELSGKFCRGCGYCMPCPVGIPLFNACRMDMLLTRSVYQNFLTEEWQQKMALIETCVNCKICATRCPYHLKPYEIIPEQLKFYRAFLKEHS